MNDISNILTNRLMFLNHLRIHHTSVSHFVLIQEMPVIFISILHSVQKKPVFSFSFSLSRMADRKKKQLRPRLPGYTTHTYIRKCCNYTGFFNLIHDGCYLKKTTEYEYCSVYELIKPNNKKPIN